MKVAKPSPRLESQPGVLLITGIFSSVLPLILPLWLWYVLGSIFVLIWNWLGNDWVSRAAAVLEQMHYHVFHYSCLSCCCSFRRHFQWSWCFSVLTNMLFLNPQPLLFNLMRSFFCLIYCTGCVRFSEYESLLEERSFNFKCLSPKSFFCFISSYLFWLNL